MPELPEMEAWRRALDDSVSAFPIVKAGPAHIATLKTFDPPLSSLEGRRLAGAERRAIEKVISAAAATGARAHIVHLSAAECVAMISGARAAGIRPLLIDRRGSGGDISSLEEIDQHL